MNFEQHEIAQNAKMWDERDSEHYRLAEKSIAKKLADKMKIPCSNTGKISPAGFQVRSVLKVLKFSTPAIRPHRPGWIKRILNAVQADRPVYTKFGWVRPRQSEKNHAKYGKVKVCDYVVNALAGFAKFKRIKNYLAGEEIAIVGFSADLSSLVLDNRRGIYEQSEYENIVLAEIEREIER